MQQLVEKLQSNQLGLRDELRTHICEKAEERPAVPPITSPTPQSEVGAVVMPSSSLLFATKQQSTGKGCWFVFINLNPWNDDRHSESYFPPAKPIRSIPVTMPATNAKFNSSHRSNQLQKSLPKLNEISASRSAEPLKTLQHSIHAQPHESRSEASTLEYHFHHKVKHQQMKTDHFDDGSNGGNGRLASERPVLKALFSDEGTMLVDLVH